MIPFPTEGRRCVQGCLFSLIMMQTLTYRVAKFTCHDALQFHCMCLKISVYEAGISRYVSAYTAGGK